MMARKTLRLSDTYTEPCYAIYARQSVDKRDSLSIESQTEDCKHSIPRDERLAIYIDKGFSGKNTDRPEFQRLMEDVQLGKIKYVVTYKLDRFSRSLLDFLSSYQILKEYGVTFLAVADGLDSSNPMGELIIKFLIIFAELERENIQRRVTDNYYYRGAQGAFLGGPPAYGFEKSSIIHNGKKTKVLVSVDETVMIVKSMYDMYAGSNLSLSEISRCLNERNVLAAKGGRWDSGKVSRLLRNPVYVQADANVYAYYSERGCDITNPVEAFVGEKGCFLYGKRESNKRKYTDVANHKLSLTLHDGIISSETFLICQHRLDSNEQINNKGSGKYTWLSGLLKCDKCGYAMKVITYKENQFLVCSGKYNYCACDGHEERFAVEDIEAAIEPLLLEKLKRLPRAEMPKDSVSYIKHNDARIRLEQIKREIYILLDRLTQMTELAVAEVDKKINGLAAERDRIHSIINNGIKEKTKNPYEDIMALAENWNNAALAEKKLVAKILIKKICILNSDIKIEWRI